MELRWMQILKIFLAIAIGAVLAILLINYEAERSISKRNLPIVELQEKEIINGNGDKLSEPSTHPADQLIDGFIGFLRRRLLYSSNAYEGNNDIQLIAESHQNLKLGEPHSDARSETPHHKIRHQRKRTKFRLHNSLIFSKEKNSFPVPQHKPYLQHEEENTITNDQVLPTVNTTAESKYISLVDENTDSYSDMLLLSFNKPEENSIKSDTEIPLLSFHNDEDNYIKRIETNRLPSVGDDFRLTKNNFQNEIGDETQKINSVAQEMSDSPDFVEESEISIEPILDSNEILDNIVDNKNSKSDLKKSLETEVVYRMKDEDPDQIHAVFYDTDNLSPVNSQDSVNVVKDLEEALLIAVPLAIILTLILLGLVVCCCCRYHRGVYWQTQNQFNPQLGEMQHEQESQPYGVWICEACCLPDLSYQRHRAAWADKQALVYSMETESLSDESAGEETPNSSTPRHRCQGVVNKRSYQPLHKLLSNLPPLKPLNDDQISYDPRNVYGDVPPMARRSQSLEHLFV